MGQLVDMLKTCNSQHFMLGLYPINVRPSFLPSFLQSIRPSFHPSIHPHFCPMDSAKTTDHRIMKLITMTDCVLMKNPIDFGDPVINICICNIYFNVLLYNIATLSDL